MSKDQEVTKDLEILNFKKKFLSEYGINLYIYKEMDKKFKIELDVYMLCALSCIKEDYPQYKFVKTIREKIRFREFLVFVQVMSYLAHKDGHTKSAIGKAIRRNHASVINHIKNVGNGFFAKDKLIIYAQQKLLNKLTEHVGTIPENIKTESNTKPSFDSIWDEAKNFIAN